jgi:hypothetical protein
MGKSEWEQRTGDWGNGEFVEIVQVRGQKSEVRDRRSETGDLRWGKTDDRPQMTESLSVISYLLFGRSDRELKTELFRITNN